MKKKKNKLAVVMLDSCNWEVLINFNVIVFTRLTLSNF